MELRTLREEDYVEAIKDGEIVKVSESIAREEDLFVLRRIIKLDTQISPEKLARRMEAGNVKSYSKLEEWKSARGNLKKNNVIKDLVSNFHWEVSRARKLKRMNRKQLAGKLGVSEEEIKIVELGELPRDDFVLISKIEGALGINLRKDKISSGVSLAELQKLNENKIKEEIDKSHGKKKDSEEKLVGGDIELLGFD